MHRNYLLTASFSWQW